MWDRSRGFATLLRLPTLLIGIVLLASGPGAPGAAEPGAATPQASPVPAPSSASRAYKDPSSGRFVSPPAVVHRRAAVAGPAAVDRSTAGLTEVAGETPAGGVRISLAGRFHSRMVARRGPDGRLTVRCREEPVAAPRTVTGPWQWLAGTAPATEPEG